MARPVPLSVRRIGAWPSKEFEVEFPLGRTVTVSFGLTKQVPGPWVTWRGGAAKPRYIKQMIDAAVEAAKSAMKPEDA